MSEESTLLSPLERFQRAWFAPSLELLGYSCRPFCLGHLIIFQAVGSPFSVLDDPAIQINQADLLTALIIVADARWPFDQLPSLCDESGELLPREKAGFELIGDQESFENAAREFLAWMGECMRGPELLEVDDPDCRPLTAPMALSYATTLLAAGNFSEERVFSMQFSLLRYYAAAFNERAGGAGFMTDELIAGIAHNKNLPDLQNATEEEIHAQAVKDLGEQGAAAFMAKRAAHREEAANG